MTSRDTYADPSTRCATLSTTTQTCVEESEAVDPNDIAIDNKRMVVNK